MAMRAFSCIFLSFLVVLPSARSATFGLRHEQCGDGFRVVNGACVDVDECAEEPVCQASQLCANTEGSYTCSCSIGYFDDGSTCRAQSYAVQTVFSFQGSPLGLDAVESEVKQACVIQLAGGISELSISISKSIFFYRESDNEGQTMVTITSLFETQQDANDAKDRFDEAAFVDRIGATLANVAIVMSPLVKPWDAEPIHVAQPSGMSINSDSIYFNWNTRTWVLDFTFARGALSSTNVVYIPRAESKTADGHLSYDADTRATFQANNFPCKMNPTPNPSSAPVPSHTVCCLLEASEQYRLSEEFESWLAGTTYATDCEDTSTTPHANSLPAGQDFVFGKLAGLDKSRVSSRGRLSDTVHLARLFLDEDEVMAKAGMVTPSPGVSSSVEVFVGLANLVPLGSSSVLDAGHSQHKVTLNKSTFVLSWQADPSEVSQQVDGVDASRVSEWRARVRLTAAEECMGETQLLASVRATLTQLVAVSSRGADRVEVTAFDVSRAGAKCADDTERGSALSSSEGHFTILLLFEDKSDAVINPSSIVSSPAVVAFEVVAKPDAVVVDNKFVRELPSKSGGGGSGAGVAVGMVLLAIAGVVGFVLVRRRRSYRKEVTLESF